jgi:large subunit ribosomal protein L10
MPNILNKRVVTEIEGFLKEAQDFVVVDFTGMSPQITEAVRRRFRGERIRMKVVKASLARIAAKNVGLPNADKVFAGTSALVYGGESIADVARAVRDLGKEKKLTWVKGVVVENQALPAAQVTALADLPTRHELLGQLLGTIIAPLTGVLGDVDALLTAVPGLTKAWEDKQGGAN